MKGLRWILVIVAVAVLASLVAGPATAGAEGRRNTALALGGLALYQLGQGNTDSAVALGLGAAVAYGRYQDAVDDERYDRYAACGRCHKHVQCNRFGYCRTCMVVVYREHPDRYPDYRWHRAPQQNRDRDRQRYQDRRGDDRRWQDRRGDDRRDADRRGGDRRWENPYERAGRQYDRRDDNRRSTPPGWERGRKEGWRR